MSDPLHWCGIILAGGQSSRMGRNKAFLELEGKPVIEHVIDKMRACTDDLILITNDPEEYDHLGIQTACDVFPHQGPLAGIHAGMKNKEAEGYVVTACDTPYISVSIYQLLKASLVDNDIVIPTYAGRSHPLSGVYRRNLAQEIECLMEEGKRSMKALYEEGHTVYMDDFNGIDTEEVDLHFFNMNHPEDYDYAKSIKKRGKEQRQLNVNMIR
ncbi:molybdenum cofactor guanylyltransferase [Thalassobacillus hwangdonensis]|uniref:molybdenum cofactor guanylyltransferase n=1 Tax=Thalassobacillus hwangdonensis TaxID=546108 RepID=UPI0036DF8906